MPFTGKNSGKISLFCNGRRVHLGQPPPTVFSHQDGAFKPPNGAFFVRFGVGQCGCVVIPHPGNVLSDGKVDKSEGVGSYPDPFLGLPFSHEISQGVGGPKIAYFVEAEIRGAVSLHVLEVVLGKQFKEVSNDLFDGHGIFGQCLGETAQGSECQEEDKQPFFHGFVVGNPAGSPAKGLKGYQGAFRGNVDGPLIVIQQPFLCRINGVYYIH